MTTLGYLAACDVARPARRARRGHHVPQRRAPRPDRGDARRAVGRPRGVRASARPGSRRSTAPSAGRSRRCGSGSSCVADALELLPLLWGPGRARLRGPRAATSRRPSATRGRCRSACRSSSAARVSGGRCGWWPSTPTAATCSAIPAACGRSSRCCTRTAPSRARSGDDRGHAPLHRAGGADGGRAGAPGGGPAPGPHAAVPVRRERPRGHDCGAGGALRARCAEAGVQTAIVRVADVGRVPDALARFAPVIAAFR